MIMMMDSKPVPSTPTPSSPPSATHLLHRHQQDPQLLTSAKMAVPELESAMDSPKGDHLRSCSSGSSPMSSPSTHPHHSSQSSPHIPSSHDPTLSPITNHSANNNKSIVTLSHDVNDDRNDAPHEPHQNEPEHESSQSPEEMSNSVTTTRSPPPEGLEKIAKLLSGGGSDEDGFANASQLFAAAVAAATVAASGNINALSPQEQILASMAPSLIQMISQNQNSQSSGDSPSSSTDDDSQSNALSSKSSTGKRRKQSKPVRYQDEPMNPFEAFESALERSKKKQQAKLRQEQRRAVVDQFGSSSMLSDADEEGEGDEDEEELEEETSRGAVAPDNQMSEDEEGEQRVERSRTHKHQSPTTKTSSTTAAATAAAEEDDALREKQQQLLFANMFSNLQQKLIHSVFCPQCNCPFANEDQLRAHIEIEHMHKLQLFDAAAKAAAAAVAASGASPNSTEAMQLRQLAEHLAMQKYQEQLQQQQQMTNQFNNKQRKRKHNRSPSSRSVSSDSSNDSSNSIDRKVSSDSNEQDLELGQLSPQIKFRKRNSKDLNHNLLQSLNHLPPNLISPLISSLNGSSKSGPQSPHSLLAQSRLVTGSPSDQISSSDQYGRQSASSPSNQAAAFASMFPSMPPSMAPFLLPMLSQSSASASSSGGHPFGPSIRDHPQSNHFGSSAPHQSSAMLNGVSVSSNSSAAAAAAAAATLRIFNPEAYCELCNKEFCNKYFLKTHKANKHGIYTPESGNERSSGSGSESRGGNVPSSVRSSNSPLLPPQSSGLGVLMPPSMATSNGHHSGPKVSPSHSSDHPFNQSQSSPNQPGLLPPGFPGGPMRLNLNMNMINLDSYCEICQKEFCNKYFLKKHKQKIHGFIFQGEQVIPPPNLAAQIAQSQQQLQQQQQQQPNPTQLQQLQHIHLLQQQIVREREREMASRQSPPLNDSVESKVTSPSTSNGPLSVITSMGGISSSDKSPLNPVTSDPSSRVTALTPEKLRAMGVINAEAFCDICCKEFCNKYFLRTHKVNKHGMFDGQSIPNKFHSNNLLVNANGPREGAFGGAQTNSQVEDTGLEPGQRDPTTYGKNGGDFLNGFTSTSGNFGVPCEKCSLHFPSSYMLNMHKFYQHNIPFDKRQSEEDEDDQSKDGELKDAKDKDDDPIDSDVETEVTGMPSLLVSAELNHETSSQHSVSSNTKDGQDLQKLHSMIKGLMPGADGSIDSRNGDESNKCMCHICKYECDNRYYLRAHLINEHGFPPTEEAFLQMFSATSGLSFLDHPPKQSDMMGGNASSEAYCEICNKEFCSKYFLKTHKQKIHNINMDGTPGTPGQNGGPPDPSQMPPALLSSLYQAAALQQQHSQKSQSPKFSSPGHSTNPTIAATIKAAIAAGLVPNSDSPNPNSQKTSVSPRGPVMTGRNYCNICNKELCNKYFMKTHMLKMHNINIDEHPIEAQQSSTIGGVQCDICQKELCSKYFLKVHKQNTHGIYEDGSAPPVLLGPSDRPFPPNGGRGGPSPGSRKMLPPQNGPMGPDSLSALNPMLFMSMMQSAAAQAATQQQANDSSDSNSACSSNSEKEAKMHGLDPVSDAGNRLLSVYQEVCQMCDRRFKSVKWLKLHMMNEHTELLQMMRTSGEITQAIAQSTGANAETLSRLCFVCGQTFGDRLTMHVHLVKEHKVNGEDLALNLASNFKIATIMAAAAAAAQQSHNSDQQSNPSDLSMRMTPSDMSMSRDDSPSRRTPHSRSSTPSSPKPDDFDPKRALLNGNHLLQNPAAALQNLLLKQSGINPMALLAASQAGNPWMSGLFGEQPKAVDYQSEDQYPSPIPPIGHGNTKNPPGKFVCQICFRTYRHSHSLQRHMITHRPKPQSQLSSSSPPPVSPITAPTANPSVPVTPSTDSKPDQNGTTAANSSEKPRNKRYRCSKCNKKFRTRELCLVHIRALHSIVNNPHLATQLKSNQASPDNDNRVSSPVNDNPPRIVFNPLSNFEVNQEDDDQEEDQPLALNLRTCSPTPEPAATDHHQLPPSPSVSSEDDLHQNTLRQTLTVAPVPLPPPRTSPYLPQSPMEEEHEDEHQSGPKDLSISEDRLPLSKRSFAHKILNLSNSNSDPKLDSPASPDPKISRPSMICVNGEKY